MRHFLRPVAVAGLFLLGVSGLMAAEVLVTDVDPNDPNLWVNGRWHVANERDGGLSEISGDNPRSGTGSADQSVPAPSGNSPKTDLEILSPDATFVAGEGWSAPSGGFGLLSQLSATSFDWYRASASTAPAHLTPALRLYVWDPDAGAFGSSYLVIWEGVYNGYPQAGGPVPTDQWVVEDVFGDYYWRVPQFLNGAWAGIGYCNSNPSQCFVFNNAIPDWGFGPNTVVFGVNFGLGSGWAGSYQGYTDNVTVGFSGDPMPTVWNFELPAPTPAVGLVGIGAIIAAMSGGLVWKLRRRES